MNEHAARVYLELCRESVLDQDRVNRVYSTKASGIITFGAALFGIGEPWRHLVGGGVVEWVLFVALGLCVTLIAVPALSLIIRPREWAKYNLESAEQDARNTASGQEVGQTLMDGAKYYRAMIAFNDKALLLKAKCLTFITWAAVAELVCFIVLTAFR